MTDLDLSKYEGHTPGPWECDPNDVTWIRTESEPYGPFGKMHVADLRGWGYLTGVGACGMDPPDAEPIHNANARLIADAPLLLAEVKRLQEAIRVQASAVRVIDQKERAEYVATATLDSQREANAILTAEVEALRQSHARLLAAAKKTITERQSGMHYSECLAGQRGYGECSEVCKALRAAVAEAEAL